METSTEYVDRIWPENLFDHNDIVLLGESHGKDNEAVLSLIEQFSLKINTVFYEKPVNLQPSIDLYFQTGRISDELEAYFDGAEKEGNNIRNGMLKIWDKLKELGIKVVCVDSSKVKTDEYKMRSPHGYYFLRGESRDEDMFNNIMEYYRTHPGKSVVVCGSNHLAEGKHFRSGKDTLGTRFKNTLPDKSESIILS